MAQQTIGVGSGGNDGTGDPLRTAFEKCNANFTELFGALSTIGISVPSSAAAPGNAGQVAYDSSYIYVCVAANTWKRSPLSTW